MKHTTASQGATWRHDSRRFTAICAGIIALVMLVGVWSVELVGIDCDRGEDRCELVNVTLLGGRVERSFAISEVAGFERNFSISTRRSRSQVYTTKIEQPVVALKDGTTLALKQRERKLAMETSTYIDLERFFAGSGESHLKRRDVFCGWWLPIATIIAALFLLALFLGTRAMRLDIMEGANTFRFRRIGLFSPARREGSLDELRACVIQSDASKPSPGVYLLTRQEEWLAITFQGALATSSAFEALRKTLVAHGVEVIDATSSDLKPQIQVTWVFAGLVGWALALVVCGVLAVAVALALAS